MDITQIAQLAKQGGRLASDKQWVLADALAQLSPTQINQVSIESGRNESTLLQYARAAERWPSQARVEGVSFSAHRVALSHSNPEGLLTNLKAQFGSPTVAQVRRAMGLEGHPAIEALEKGLKKLDRKVSERALRQVIDQLTAYVDELDALAGMPDMEDEGDWDGFEEQYATNEEPNYDQNTDEEALPQEEVADTSKGTWQPPIRTSDIAGI